MKKKGVVGVLFLTPVLILIGFVFLYPAFSIIRSSFFATKYGIEFDFVGIQNYLHIFQDVVFQKSAINSLIWTGAGVFLQLTIPMGTAILLNQRFFGNTFARSAMLIPWITPSVIIAIMARWLLEPSLGAFNDLIQTIGIVQEPVNFLGSNALALPTLIGMQTWQFIPFGTLLILAALQTISPDLYDAMRVDGAGPLQVFRYLIFPRIGPMIGFVVFLAFVWNFNVFGKIWLTTQGGPVNATMTLPLLVYKKAFRSFNMGEASAVASLVVGILVILGLIYFEYLWKPVGED